MLEKNRAPTQPPPIINEHSVTANINMSHTAWGCGSPGDCHDQHTEKMILIIMCHHHLSIWPVTVGLYDYMCITLLLQTKSVAGTTILYAW